MDQNQTPASTPAGGSGGNKALWIIIAILIIGGLIWYFAAGKKSGNNTAMQTKSANETTGQMQEANSGQGTFKDLMAMGTPQTCQVSFNSASTTSEGTVYLAGGKMRGDFSSQVNGQTMTMHMINMDQTAYTWMDGQTMGYKVMATTTSQSAMNDSHAVNENQNVQYNCKAWNEDDSQFALPANINFMDSGSMMNGMPNMPKSGAMMAPQGGAAGGSNAAECAACNSAPASAQAQCKAALGCK